MIYTYSLEDFVLFELDVRENGWVKNVKLFLLINIQYQTKEVEDDCEFLYREEKENGIFYSTFGYFYDFDTPCTGTYYFEYWIDNIGPHKTVENSFVILNHF